jgi:hypothetical protein
MPISVGIAALATFAVLAVFMFTIGGSLLGGIVGEIEKAVGQAVARVASQAPATAGPSGVALDTPILDPPANHGYTSQPSVVLSGSVPRSVVGKSGYQVRVYIVGGQAVRTRVVDVQIGGTTRFSTSGITLTEGPNTFVTALVSPSGEGGSSPPVVYTLDTKPPALTITSPGLNVLVKGTSVNISGKSEDGVTIAVRNRQAPGGAPNSVVVGANGTFKLNVRLVTGDNNVDVTATDQADNTSATLVRIKRDYGQLAAHLTASPTKINSNVTTTLTLTVHATSSTGSPLTDATVVFSVRVSGLGPIDHETRTDATGTATWTTKIAGAVPGTGWATVVVTSDLGDEAKGSTPLNAY